MNKPTPGERAFTLIEVLLAVALGGSLLAAASIYVVSLTGIWLNRGDDDFFNQHVDGVTLFLTNALAQSEGFGEEQTDPVSWGRPPGYSELDEPLLTFLLKESPALLAWEHEPLPGVSCHLFFREGEGLSLIWFSRHNNVEDIEDAYRTVVSPFITHISYCYFDIDSETWEIVDHPEEDRDGQFLLPEFLKIRFEHEDEMREIPIYLPQRTQAIPLF